MSGERPLVPIAAVSSDRASAAFFVRGRVLEVDGDSVLLVDASGRVWARSPTPYRRGAVLMAVLERSAEGLTIGHAWVVFEGAAHGLHPDGDVRTMLADPARLPRLATRARAVRAMRAYFERRGYVEVETPTLVSNPGMDVHLDAFRVPGALGGRWLGTSPEYAMKRLVAAGMERIFQITRAYRRDEVGPMHEPEFTILEWYQAQATAEVVMDETELLVQSVVRACNDESTCVTRGDETIDFGGRWERLTVRDAVRDIAGLDLDELLRDETRLFEVLATVVQPELGRGRPTWLVDWPIELASLARPKPGDARVAERFEAYAQGIELCNGFGELTDPSEQRRRFEADASERARLGKDAYPVDEAFLRALEDGLPPCAGNAVGVDRVVMLALGADTIADVRAFGVRDV